MSSNAVELVVDIIMQLASDAQSVIAMTDDEKKRVEELLADLDSLPEIPEENSVNEVAAFSTVSILDSS